jgi:hypothetical protein
LDADRRFTLDVAKHSLEHGEVNIMRRVHVEAELLDGVSDQFIESQKFVLRIV